MDAVQVTLVVVRMDSSFVRFLEIMTNMKEFRVVEIVSKRAILAIGSCQACEPVICHKDAWFDLVDAAIFKTSFVKNSNLENYVSSTIALIWCWENISIM